MHPARRWIDPEWSSQQSLPGAASIRARVHRLRDAVRQLRRPARSATAHRARKHACSLSVFRSWRVHQFALPCKWNKSCLLMDRTSCRPFPPLFWHKLLPPAPAAMPRRPDLLLVPTQARRSYVTALPSPKALCWWASRDQQPAIPVIAARSPRVSPCRHCSRWQRVQRSKGQNRSKCWTELRSTLADQMLRWPNRWNTPHSHAWSPLPLALQSNLMCRSNKPTAVCWLRYPGFR